MESSCIIERKTTVNKKNISTGYLKFDLPELQSAL